MLPVPIKRWGVIPREVKKSAAYAPVLYSQNPISGIR